MTNFPNKPKPNMQKTNQNIPLLVTTAHKGVFFGYGQPTDKTTIRITDARMCVYWSSDVRGIVGLAATGPSSSCKVTAAAPAVTLRDVTAVMEVSKEAEAKWLLQNWK